MFPVNHEIYGKKSLSTVKKLHFVQWDIFSAPSGMTYFDDEAIQLWQSQMTFLMFLVTYNVML